MTDPEPTPRAEIKTDHIRKAVMGIGSFLAVICLVVLAKGLFGSPRVRHDPDPAVAAPARTEGGDLSAYQEKLQQYRQSQHDDGRNAAGSGGTGTSSVEDQQFVKQQLRLPMLVKDTATATGPASDSAAAAVPDATPLPGTSEAAPGTDLSMQQRLAELHRRLAALNQQQQTLQKGTGP